jgi:hypothetical protein
MKGCFAMQDKSSIEPQNSVFDPALKTVFDAAQETLRAHEAAEMQQFLTQQRRKAERQENLEFFKELTLQELGPLFSILMALPEKDGKRFSVEEKIWESCSDGYEARIVYGAPGADAPGLSQPATTFGIYEVSGQFLMAVTQEAILNNSSSSERFLTRYAPTFDAVRREFGIGLANFAPDRLAEIGAAFAAAAEKPETFASPVITAMEQNYRPTRRLTVDRGWDSD